jgi:tetratricopeptide (TPR) repeat protein
LTAAITGIIPGTVKPFQNYFSRFACTYESRGSANHEQLLVLVSPLEGDNDGSQTSRLLTAFHGQGFNAVQICDTIAFDPGKDLASAESETVAKGAKLIERGGADLLLFGKVVIADRSLLIWAINEHGGCSPKPTPLVLREGLIPDEFSPATRQQLLAVSLAEIASACEHQEKVIWPVFAKRIKRIGALLDQSSNVWSKQEWWKISIPYSDAMLLLYGHDQGEEWFRRARDFDLKLIETIASDPKATSGQKSSTWFLLGKLMAFRANKVSSSEARDEAIAAFDKSLDTLPNSPEILSARGAAFVDAAKYDRAIADYSNALTLQVSSNASSKEVADILIGRATAYRESGQLRLARSDLDRAIQLDRSAVSSRCWWRALAGGLTSALVDCDKAIGTAYAIDLDSRGLFYLRTGNFGAAAADYGAVLKLDPKSASALFGRGVAKIKSGDRDAGMKDVGEARRLQADIDLKYAKNGVVLK